MAGFQAPASTFYRTNETLEKFLKEEGSADWQTDRESGWCGQKADKKEARETAKRTVHLTGKWISLDRSFPTVARHLSARVPPGMNRNNHHLEREVSPLLRSKFALFFLALRGTEQIKWINLRKLCHMATSNSTLAVGTQWSPESEIHFQLADL